MTQAASQYERWSTPTLLRHARNAYRVAIREALVGAGYDDLPRDGAYLVVGVAHAGMPLGELIRHLDVSKQTGGHLVDTLVVRGYLDRSIDPVDRRRVIITLTQRGDDVAAVVRSTIDHIDDRLEERVGAESLVNARAVLASLVESDADPSDDSHSRGR